MLTLVQHKEVRKGANVDRGSCMDPDLLDDSFTTERSEMGQCLSCRGDRVEAWVVSRTI